MTRRSLLGMCALVVMLSASDSHARRAHITPEQQTKLQQIQRVVIQAVSLTEKGRRDPASLAQAVAARMSALGYEIAPTPDDPHDVVLHVKCEERKTWAGTTAAGGDAELPDAPSRLWKGPACLFSYRLEGRDLGWRKEIRTAFDNAREAAAQAHASDSGAYAMEELLKQVETYDFPALLAAEWGQVDRLLALLNQSDTPKLRKLNILSILSDLNAQEALPQLTAILKDTDLQQEAVSALSGVGQDSIPLLIDLFQHSQQTAVRAEAAKALGTIAATSGDPRTIPPLVAYLTRVASHLKNSGDIDFPVLTEVVWAIGKLRDERSIEPMKQLQDKIWVIYDNSPAMTKLREATNWSYKQLDLDGHIS